tara:strand:- start:28 stop:336 length:309 start_codon:yes stop_codon:yes gene_type:complete
MGFNGGGGGALLNHEHDGTLVADGGPLDFKNITQSSMSAGSMTFSDGAHLQERAIGAVSDVLTVAGGVPTWAAAAAGGASCSDSLTISGQTNTLCKWLELGA